jgi:hypothetical protein
MAGEALASNAPYLAGKPCPKCGYVRNASDTNPDWQCPGCGIAYAKFQPGGAAPLARRLAAGGRELAAEARSDHSVFALVAANLLALLVAWATGMSLRELMLVYWIQSAIIGVTSALRILNLQDFSTANMTMNDQPLDEVPATKWRVAGFFMLHYGMFHFGYLMFIGFSQEPQSGGSSIGYLLCALVFAANHGYSLAQNIRKDAAGRPNIGTLMFLPYARIVPMHITILAGGTFAGGGGGGIFLLFGTLKVAADVVMHTVEHHVLARGSVLPPS